MSECFPGPESLEEKVKVALDLSNYAAKSDFKQVLLIHRNLLARFSKLKI